MSAGRGGTKRHISLPRYLQDYDMTGASRRASVTNATTQDDGPDTIVAPSTPPTADQQHTQSEGRPSDQEQTQDNASLVVALEDLKLQNLQIRKQQNDRNEELRSEIKHLSSLMKQLKPHSSGKVSRRRRHSTPSPRRSGKHSSSPSPHSSASSSPSPERSSEKSRVRRKSSLEPPRYKLPSQRHEQNSWPNRHYRQSPARRYSTERRPARSPEYSRTSDRRHSRHSARHYSPDRPSSHSRRHRQESYRATSHERRCDRSRYETPRRRHSRRRTASPSGDRERSYRGPKPSIPDFTQPNPREFARLRIALENLLPRDATERFKFQILCDHLKLEEALLVADSYVNSRYPYSDTMDALNEQYGQPHQLALQRIAELMEGPSIMSGDIKAFRTFALKVRSLVSMLKQLGIKGRMELECGSHVSRLLGKLPHDLRASFRRYIHPHDVPIPTLHDLSNWLEFELQVQVDTSRYSTRTVSRWESVKPAKPTHKPTTILLGSEGSPESLTNQVKGNKYCPYCDNEKHSLNNCANFSQLTTAQQHSWIKDKNKCWRCGRGHRAAECDLKMTCKTCNKRHLLVLHNVNTQSQDNMGKSDPKSDSCLLNTTEEILYVDRPPESRNVLLKVSKVILRNEDKFLETFAVLDDGSERTILLHSAAQELGLHGAAEELPLRTVRQDFQLLHGAAVSFMLSPAAQPHKVYPIKGAFTAKELGLAEHTHPVDSLVAKYGHLRGVPLQRIERAHPVLLIGSDYPHLITPIEPVRLGPPGGPAAVRTRLGWTLQGPAQKLKHWNTAPQCFLTITSAAPHKLSNQEEHLNREAPLWHPPKVTSMPQQDQDVLPEDVGATPLPCSPSTPECYVSKEQVLLQLSSTKEVQVEYGEQTTEDVAEAEATRIVKLPPGPACTPISCCLPLPMVSQLVTKDHEDIPAPPSDQLQTRRALNSPLTNITASVLSLHVIPEVGSITAHIPSGPYTAHPDIPDIMPAPIGHVATSPGPHELNMSIGASWMDLTKTAIPFHGAAECNNREAAKPLQLALPDCTVPELALKAALHLSIGDLVPDRGSHYQLHRVERQRRHSRRLGPLRRQGHRMFPGVRYHDSGGLTKAIKAFPSSIQISIRNLGAAVKKA